MKLYVRILILFVIFASNFSSHAIGDDRESPVADLAIVGGQLIDGYGGSPLQNSIILINDNRIVGIGRVGELEIHDNTEIIDSNGTTVIPGLWESHGHLYHVAEGDPGNFPVKFRERVFDVMAANARISLYSGITSFRDTGGPIEPQIELRKDIASGHLPGPRLFLAGPILRQRDADSTTKKETLYHGKNYPTIGSVKEARQVTNKLISMGVDQIKVKGFWDLDILREIVSTAHEAGLGVDADVRHMIAYKTAIEAGVDRLHHVFTADPLVDYSDDEMRLLIRGMKPNEKGPMANIIRGPYMIPTVEMRQAYVRILDFPEAVDHPRFADIYPKDVYNHLINSWKNPSSSPRGMGVKERMKMVKNKLRQFIEKGGREQIVAGTDAGSPFNFHSPLTRELVHLQEAGLTTMEVIQSATLRAAQMQGVDSDLGTISVGKLADVIIVDGDPLQDITLLQHNIVLIIKDGKIYNTLKH